MRYTRYKIFLSCIITVCILTGCNSGKKQDAKKEGFTEYEMALTNKDTTAVIQLVDLFMQHLESGRYVDAATMLYQSDPNDNYGDCEPLDNDELQDVIKLLKEFPVKKHRIEYIKFNEVYDNEVKCIAVMEEPHDGIPEISTVFYFKPIDYLGKWILCLLNSRDGDTRTKQGHLNHETPRNQ